MRIRKELLITMLILFGVILAVSQSRSADQLKPAAEQEDPPPPKPVTRVYDVRVLLAEQLDLPFSTSPHAAAFVVPPSLQGPDQSSYGGSVNSDGSAAMVFGPPSRPPEPRENVVSNLIGLIQFHNDPDSWRENGGQLGAIHEREGILMVTQTEDNQKQIAAFLRQLIAARNDPVRTTADWLLLAPGDVDKLLKPLAGDESGLPREVDPAALEKLPPAVKHYRAELPGNNGQTLHSLSGHEKSVTVNATAQLGTAAAAFSPLVGIVADGVGIQVTPVVDRESSSALVTVLSTYNADQQNGPLMTLHSIATTQPVSDDPISSSTANASYYEVSSTVQEFRSTLRVPLNVPVVAGAMTLTPTEKGDDRELVLILCVHANK